MRDSIPQLISRELFHSYRILSQYIWYHLLREFFSIHFYTHYFELEFERFQICQHGQFFTRLCQYIILLIQIFHDQENSDIFKFWDLFGSHLAKFFSLLLTKFRYSDIFWLFWAIFTKWGSCFGSRNNLIFSAFPNAARLPLSSGKIKARKFK